MNRLIFYLNFLSEREFLILRELIYYDGDSPTYLAKRLNLDLKEVLEGLKLLRNLGLIEEKKKRIIYYEIKGEFRNFLKNLFEQRGVI